MNNREEYKKAIDEIKVGDDVEEKAINKIKQKEEKKSYKFMYAFASVAIVLVIVLSIGIPMRSKTAEEEKDPITIIEKEGGLPKIANFEQLYGMLKENAKETNSRYITDVGMMFETAAVATTGTDSMVKSEASSTEDYSATNVQVRGVDEADIVKTDGEYIYYIGTSKVVIVDARDSKNMKIVKEIKYEDEEKSQFSPDEIFIKDNKLIIIGSKSIFDNKYENENSYMYYYPRTNNYTVTKVYNVENKSKPILDREIEIEGNYLSSRMIDDNVYVISNKYLYSYICRDYAINEIKEEDFKTKYIDTTISKDAQCVNFDNIYYFPNSEDTSYLNIAGFNVNNNEKVNIESYLGAGDKIYSSEKNLYVTRVKYDYKDEKVYGYYNNYDVNTYIYKFNLQGANVIYLETGNVPGEVLNQFSMDEKDGYFRIATTDSQNWNDETNTNNIYVLDKKLQIVGRLENLAKGEKIYSVRFMGNRVYMVTFVETDPLFVIDLSEPTEPSVLGELKIPGYSKYLHPYDETHIVGFGEDTKIVNYGYGDVVTTNGMKMALFDVTNPNNPIEMYSIKIGDKGTYSELLYNHKALLFSKEKNIIAFPITISADENNYRSNLKFQGAIIYGMNLEDGFSLRGRIAHMQIEDGYRDYDYYKEVERIIYINNTLFTLSKGMIKATDMNTMEQLGELEIETVGESKYWYID